MPKWFAHNTTQSHHLNSNIFGFASLVFDKKFGAARGKQIAPVSLFPHCHPNHSYHFIVILHLIICIDIYFRVHRLHFHFYFHSK